MTNSFDLLIQELTASMQKLKDDEGVTSGLLKLLKDAGLIIVNSNNNLIPAAFLSKELQDVLAALLSQDSYTVSTSDLLNKLASSTNPATPKNLETATNLIQIYFQVTQPLEQILSDLVDNLPSPLPKTTSPTVTPTDIQNSIQQIIRDREKLLEVQDKALQEFGDVLDELSLEQLARASNSIKIELKNLSNPSFPALSAATNRLINHLENTRKFFSNFSKNNGDLTNNEPSQIKTLISNWRESISIIETLEQTDLIRQELSYPGKSRSAIAQSIKIHDLLEANYDFLTALVRSIDLVSAGSL